MGDDADSTLTDPWMAGDHPGRPFDAGTWLDDCSACVRALELEAAERPGTVLCIRTNCDRVLVTVEHLVQTLAAGRSVASLCFVPGDWVRDIFVPVDGWLPYGERWWSMTKFEQERRPFEFLLSAQQGAHEG